MSDFISISIHSSISHLPRRRRNFKNIKAAVVKAGRFSTFDACEVPGVFAKLVRESDIMTFKMGFPWTGIRRVLSYGERQVNDRLKRIEDMLFALEIRAMKRQDKALSDAINARTGPGIVFLSSTVRQSEVTRWRRWAAVVEKERVPHG